MCLWVIELSIFPDGFVAEVLLYGLLPGTEMESRKKHSDDTDVFRDAMSGVTPLKSDNRRLHDLPKPPARPVQRELDEARVMHELLDPPDEPLGLETGEELLFLRPGYPPRLLRRLRRGHFSIADCIDLHHLSEITAREVLLRFLNGSVQSGFGAVRVIHGKGLRSRSLPKLKLMTHGLLRRHPAVIAFASCQPRHGGTGAVDVLLKNYRSGAR